MVAVYVDTPAQATREGRRHSPEVLERLAGIVEEFADLFLPAQARSGADPVALRREGCKASAGHH